MYVRTAGAHRECGERQPLIPAPPPKHATDKHAPPVAPLQRRKGGDAEGKTNQLRSQFINFWRGQNSSNCSFVFFFSCKR